MRLCRFRLDDLILIGFYADDHVIPIDQAAEAYCDETAVELLLPTTGNLLDLLPPDGAAFESLSVLYDWVEELDVIDRDELAIPIDEVEVLVPIASPCKLLLLAGNYASHVVERGGIA